jgi:hypothetical protein
MTKEEIRKITIQEIFDKSKFNDFGFKYLKSKSCFEKRIDTINYNIGFGSMKTNILDNVNIVIANAGVSDNKFAIWQKEKLGHYPSGQIGCAKIKNLFIEGPPWHDFNLTDDEEIRKSVVNEISNILSTDVLMFFEIFDEPLNIIDKLNYPCFSVSTIIEYFEYKNLQKYIPDIIDKKSENHQDLKKEIDYYIGYLKSNDAPIGGFKETYTNKTKLIASQIAETLTKINNS